MKKESGLDDSIWLTWERQTRNRSASTYIGVPLTEIVYDNKSSIYRYLMSSFLTLKIIIMRRPRYLFVQNPSLVLCLIGLVCSKVFRLNLVVDAHNSGVFFEGRFKNLVNLFNHLIIKKSQFVIVTNSELAKVIKAIGGKPLVLPDPLPNLPISVDYERFDRVSEGNKIKAFCITSWGDDEPIKELIDAAAKFSSSIDFYFTGNFRKSSVNLVKESLPENVYLLGFVEESTYFSLLQDCDFTIDLTTRIDCLVCGAYESVAAEKPIILSDTKPQREYFYKGAIFCDVNSTGIAIGIGEVLRNLKYYSAEIKCLKSEILDEQEEKRTNFILSIVGSTNNRSTGHL